jgi:hypothetical protein
VKSLHCFIFLLFVVTRASNLCSTILPIYGIFPTTSEQINLDLSEFFVGTNLTFSQLGAPSTSSVEARGYIASYDSG